MCVYITKKTVESIMAPAKVATNKKGGNMTKELAKLSVPFGIVLAQKGLLNYLDSQKSSKKATKAPKSGGCGEHVEYASVSGGGKKVAAPKKAAPKPPKK